MVLGDSKRVPAAASMLRAKSEVARREIEDVRRKLWLTREISNGKGEEGSRIEGILLSWLRNLMSKQVR